MKTLLTLNHVLITLFTTATGVFKIVGLFTNGNADVVLFAKIGFTLAMVLIFGVVAAGGGLGPGSRKTLRRSAVLAASCNALGSFGLVMGGGGPFGAISLLFVVMALLELKRAPLLEGV